MKRNFEVAMVFCGAVIGAGFASGREILAYFATFSKGGILGCITLLVVFTVSVYAILSYSYQKRVYCYTDLLTNLFRPTFRRIVTFLVTLFLFASFFVMASGAGALLHEQFGWHKSIGILLLIAISFVVLLFDIKGLARLNLYLTPVLIVGIMLISLHAVFDATSPVFAPILKTAVFNPVTSALIYVSYNMLMSTPVLIPLARFLENRRDAKISAVLCGVLLFVSTIAVYFAMYFTYLQVLPYDIPLLKLASAMGPWAEYLYCAVMIFALLTSSVAAGYGFVEKLAADLKLPPKVVLLGMCLLAIPFATLGFANLVSALYGFFGVAGLIVLLATVYQCIRKE